MTLCAAVAVISYLEVGQRLRMWMPVFLYACSVTGEGRQTKRRHVPRVLAVARIDMLEREHILGCGSGVAAFVLTMGGIVLEGAKLTKLGAGGVFGWLSTEYLLKAW